MIRLTRRPPVASRRPPSGRGPRAPVMLLPGLALLVVAVCALATPALATSLISISQTGLFDVRFSDGQAQREPAVAGDVVYWVDGRDQATTAYDIYALDRGVDPAVEIPVCTASGSQWSPRAWGDHVVWSDARSDAGDVYGAVVDTAAHTASAPFAIRAAAGWQYHVDTAGDLVVWTDYQSIDYDDPYDVWGAEVDWAARTVGTPFPIAADDGPWETAPTVSYVGAEAYRVVWLEKGPSPGNDDYDVWGATVGRTSTPDSG